MRFVLKKIVPLQFISKEEYKFLIKIKMLEIETKIFEQKLPELLQTSIGKFVLIKGNQIIGVFAAMEDALNCGYEKFREQPFFVREILPMQPPLNFTYHHLFC